MAFAFVTCIDFNRDWAEIACRSDPLVLRGWNRGHGDARPANPRRAGASYPSQKTGSTKRRTQALRRLGLGFGNEHLDVLRGIRRAANLPR